MARTTTPNLSPQYLAGFFDGEGHVRFVVQPNGWRYAMIGIGNSDQEILNQIALQYGGTLRNHDRSTGIHKFWEWYASHKNGGLEFVQDILPYSVIKRSQLDLWLEAIQITTHSRGKKLTESELDLRFGYAQKLLRIRSEGMVKI